MYTAHIAVSHVLWTIKNHNLSLKVVFLFHSFLVLTLPNKHFSREANTSTVPELLTAAAILAVAVPRTYHEIQAGYNITFFQ